MTNLKRDALALRILEHFKIPAAGVSSVVLEIRAGRVPTLTVTKDLVVDSQLIDIVTAYRVVPDGELYDVSDQQGS